MLSKKEDFYIGVFVVSLWAVGLFFNVGPTCMIGWASMIGECSDIVKPK